MPTDFFALPAGDQFLRVTARLFVAVLLGGVLGYEREREGKAAGLRTHMLVCLGAALFTIAPLEAGMGLTDVSRVYQGIATGIGFIGAGTILKRTEHGDIQGLTTAASIWLTAAVGLAVGAGPIWIPAMAALLALIDSLGVHIAGHQRPASRQPARQRGEARRAGRILKCGAPATGRSAIVTPSAHPTLRFDGGLTHAPT